MSFLRICALCAFAFIVGCPALAKAEIPNCPDLKYTTTGIPNCYELWTAYQSHIDTSHVILANSSGETPKCDANSALEDDNLIQLRLKVSPPSPRDAIFSENDTNMQIESIVIKTCCEYRAVTKDIIQNAHCVPNAVNPAEVCIQVSSRESCEKLIYSESWSHYFALGTHVYYTTLEPCGEAEQEEPPVGP
jgi:hypothetical protein